MSKNKGQQTRRLYLGIIFDSKNVKTFYMRLGKHNCLYCPDMCPDKREKVNKFSGFSQIHFNFLSKFEKFCSQLYLFIGNEF